MGKDHLENIADKGSRESFKLDKVSSSALHRIQAIYRMNCGLYVRKDYLVRTSIRFYMDHLKRTDSIHDEVERLTKAVEGRL